MLLTWVRLALRIRARRCAASGQLGGPGALFLDGKSRLVGVWSLEIAGGQITEHQLDRQPRQAQAPRSSRRLRLVTDVGEMNSSAGRTRAPSAGRMRGRGRGQRRGGDVPGSGRCVASERPVTWQVRWGSEPDPVAVTPHSGQCTKYAGRYRAPSGSFHNPTGIEGIGSVMTSSPSSFTISLPSGSNAFAATPRHGPEISPSYTG